MKPRLLISPSDYPPKFLQLQFFQFFVGKSFLVRIPIGNFFVHGILLKDLSIALWSTWSLATSVHMGSPLSLNRITFMIPLSIPTIPSTRLGLPAPLSGQVTPDL